MLKPHKPILDFELDEGIFDLSAAQKKRISKAKLETKQKKVLTEVSANKETREWLNK